MCKVAGCAASPDGHAHTCATAAFPTGAHARARSCGVPRRPNTTASPAHRAANPVVPQLPANAEALALGGAPHNRAARGGRGASGAGRVGTSGLHAGTSQQHSQLRPLPACTCHSASRTLCAEETIPPYLNWQAPSTVQAMPRLRCTACSAHGSAHRQARVGQLREEGCCSPGRGLRYLAAATGCCAVGQCAASKRHIKPRYSLESLASQPPASAKPRPRATVPMTKPSVCRACIQTGEASSGLRLRTMKVRSIACASLVRCGPLFQRLRCPTAPNRRLTGRQGARRNK